MVNALASLYVLVLESFLPRTALHLFAVRWGCNKVLELLKKGDVHARWQYVTGIFVSFSSSLPSNVNRLLSVKCFPSH